MRKQSGGPRVWYTYPMAESRPPRVAVIIPCKDEEATIASVLDKFKVFLPDADLYVIDNNCRDDTARVAREHGATVLRESRPGKGNAVRKAFREVAADIYLLTDGDDTYPVEDAPRMLEPIRKEQADVVVGVRLHGERASEFRWINKLGNHLLVGLLNVVFSTHLTDLLSGYRAMTREFVKQAPVLSSGFELETELSILALERGFRTVEIAVTLKRRPAGGRSKIKVFRDGVLIVKTMFALQRDYRPMRFFGRAGILFILLGLLPGARVTLEFMEYGTVKIPSAVLATGLEICGMSLTLTGVILTAINRRFRELDHRLTMLSEATRPPEA
jgi:glycosyltransferase involved in cell wall biosynthesis